MDNGLAHAAGERTPHAPPKAATVPDVAEVASAPDAAHGGDVPGLRAGYVAGGADVAVCCGGKAAGKAVEGLGDQSDALDAIALSGPQEGAQRPVLDPATLSGRRASLEISACESAPAKPSDRGASPQTSASEPVPAKPSDRGASPQTSASEPSGALSSPGESAAAVPPLPGLPPADIVSVPEAAGREALTRLLGYGQPAVTPGPVALSAHGRVLFLVAPGGSEDLPELLD